MKNPVLTFATLSMLLCASCAPKVYTSILKSHPARPAEAPVLVYSYTDSLPEVIEVVGKVEVRDNGMSTNCSYPQVLQLAKAETNKAGGNCFMLTWHRPPALFGSSCHQIAGSMLLLPDSVVEASQQDNLWAQNAYVGSFQPPIQPRREKTKHTPCIVSLNAGYSFVTSKMELIEGLTGNPKQGLDISGSFQWISLHGLGGGIRYSGYFTSVDSDDTKINVRLHYFAPEFALHQQIGRSRWHFHESVGIGYAGYTESANNLSFRLGGLGFHTDLGIEYKFTPHIGIGVGAGFYGARFFSADYPNSDYPPNEKAGITRISLNGGVRFHF